MLTQRMKSAVIDPETSGKGRDSAWASLHVFVLSALEEETGPRLG
jgi:hypothetical protein